MLLSTVSPEKMWFARTKQYPPGVCPGVGRNSMLMPPISIIRGNTSKLINSFGILNFSLDLNINLSRFDEFIMGTSRALI